MATNGRHGATLTEKHLMVLKQPLAPGLVTSALSSHSSPGSLSEALLHVHLRAQSTKLPSESVEGEGAPALPSSTKLMREKPNLGN